MDTFLTRYAFPAKSLKPASIKRDGFNVFEGFLSKKLNIGDRVLTPLIGDLAN